MRKGRRNVRRPLILALILPSHGEPWVAAGPKRSAGRYAVATMMLSPQHPAMQGEINFAFCELANFGRALLVGSSVLSLRAPRLVSCDASHLF